MFDSLNPALRINVAELNTGDTAPLGWSTHIHPQGWVYFVHKERKVVTDEDVRSPEALCSVEKYLSTYPLAEIDENMEVLVPPNVEPDDHSMSISHHSTLASSAFSCSTFMLGVTLALNHLHCTASYTIDEVKTENFSKLEQKIRAL